MAYFGESKDADVDVAVTTSNSALRTPIEAWSFLGP